MDEQAAIVYLLDHPNDIKSAGMMCAYLPKLSTEWSLSQVAPPSDGCPFLVRVFNRIEQKWYEDRLPSFNLAIAFILTYAR